MQILITVVAVIFLVFSIRWKLDKQIQKTQITSRTHALHRQMLISLIVQVIVPFAVLGIPFILSIVFFQNENLKNICKC
jgi:hypothetical protein